MEDRTFHNQYVSYTVSGDHQTQLRLSQAWSRRLVDENITHTFVETCKVRTFTTKQKTEMAQST